MILVVVYLAFTFAGLGISLALYLRKRAAAAAVEVRVRDAAQSRAMHLVWEVAFGQDLDWSPRIEWVAGSRLNCVSGRGWTTNGMCVAGMSWRDTQTCAVAWPTGTTRFSDTAFAHELLHARSWHTGEVSDHNSPEFQADVARANAALREAGL